jgi:hypothetical protein
MKDPKIRWMIWGYPYFSILGKFHKHRGNISWNMVDDWTKWRDDCGRIQTFEGVQEKQIRNYSLVNKQSNETNPPLADALSAQSGDFLCLFHSECCGQSFPQIDLEVGT